MTKRSLERQIKYLSEKERRDRVEKLAAFEKDAMAKHKKKICIDENLSGVIEPMKKIGYNVFEFEKGMEDEDLHRLMNKENVKFFFTSDYDDFKKFKYPKFPNPRYEMFEISQKELVEKRMVDEIAKIFDWLLMHYEEYYSKRIILNKDVININNLKSYGCHL